MTTPPELDDARIRRLDFVHNRIHAMLCELAGTDIPWDIEAIGEISDFAEAHVCGKLGLMDAMAFAPYVETG